MQTKDFARVPRFCRQRKTRFRGKLGSDSNLSPNPASSWRRSDGLAEVLVYQDRG